MSKYRVTMPFIHDMGSISPFTVTPTPMDTAAQQALWQINSMRDHDGLPHLTRMPVGVRYELIKEAFKPDVTLSTGRIVKHSRLPNGAWAADSTPGDIAMTYDEYAEYVALTARCFRFPNAVYFK